MPALMCQKSLGMLVWIGSVATWQLVNLLI